MEGVKTVDIFGPEKLEFFLSQRNCILIVVGEQNLRY